MIPINLLPQKPLDPKRWVSISAITLVLLVTVYYLSSALLSSSSKKNHTYHASATSKGTLRHSVRTLRMTGFLKKSIAPDSHLIWGLIKDPDTNVTVVKVGDRIGKENLPVTAITPKGIQLQSLEKTKCFIPTISTA